MEKEALLYAPIENGKVQCALCAHRCRIEPGEYGICGVRKNDNGTLMTLVYGSLIAANVDPIEKKPLYHFLPGTPSLSVATVGCNFRCGFCQNWQISQVGQEENTPTHTPPYSPEAVVTAARNNNCRSIAYTYTEPTIFFEFAFDTAKAAAEQGLKNVFVTNGYMTSEAIHKIRPYLHAANIDLKSFRDDFYRKICKARLAPVLASIRQMHEQGIWIELTTLIVPGQNDSEDELTAIARFIAEVDPSIPWHISRYHPDYKYDHAPATPEPVLRQAERIGRDAGLKYIYIGNLPGESNTTRCPGCGEILIRRDRFAASTNRIRDGKCPGCGETIAGVFDRT